MSDLDEQFVLATEAVKAIAKRPNNDTLLKLYACFKQATQGDNRGKRPGILDQAGRAKFDAWQKLSGTSTAEAQQAYVDLVEELRS